MITMMKGNKIPAILLLNLMLLTGISGCYSQNTIASPVPADPFMDRVLKERNQKDAEFRDPKKSPLPSDEISDFQGLQYFSYQSKYRVTASLERIDHPAVIKMKTTTERRPEYLTYAYAHFFLDGVEYKLMIYQPVDFMNQKGFEKYLFMPFTDATSGIQTYGGGRFMELTMVETDTITLDFNTAFNPYCAYNHKYSCPVPPEENDLPVPVPVGELPYKPIGREH